MVSDSPRGLPVPQDQSTRPPCRGQPSNTSAFPLFQVSMEQSAAGGPESVRVSGYVQRTPCPTLPLLVQLGSLGTRQALAVRGHSHEDAGASRRPTSPSLLCWPGPGAAWGVPACPHLQAHLHELILECPVQGSCLTVATSARRQPLASGAMAVVAAAHAKLIAALGNALPALGGAGFLLSARPWRMTWWGSSQRGRRSPEHVQCWAGDPEGPGLGAQSPRQQSQEPQEAFALVYAHAEEELMASIEREYCH
ncbi:uncharacterized protein LOC102494678 [Tupaia chinensis]|uniref:uncharacterized protein LOC102494678 n=1 Tax=Tupaia chinensis TaxID=246437 RepID=UPI0007044A2C|nr:uncharacterized protein LOC102494678 [Tupaia chinensis]